MEFPDGRVFSRHGTSWPYTLAPLAILVHMHTFELSNAVLLAKLAARVCYNVESGGEHVCKAPTIWKSPQNIHTEVTCGQVVKSIWRVPGLVHLLYSRWETSLFDWKQLDLNTKLNTSISLLWSGDSPPYMGWSGDSSVWVKYRHWE